MKGANSRIKEKYLPHLAEIAEIYVRLRGNCEGTAREARRLPDCGSVKALTISRWRTNAEFAAFVREAEDGRANQLRLRPAVRGPERIAWLIEVERQLRARLENKAGDERTESDQDKTLRAALLVGQEIRAEEDHYESMQKRVAARQFARFLKNLVEFVKRRHAAAHATVFPILRDALNHLDAIQSGQMEDAA